MNMNLCKDLHIYFNILSQIQSQMTNSLSSPSKFNKCVHIYLSIENSLLMCAMEKKNFHILLKELLSFF